MFRFPCICCPISGKIQGELWRKLTTSNNWGIFDKDNKPIAIADSVLDMGYKNQYKIANYPIQNGGFVSYNKVASPYEATVRLCKGGNLSAFNEAVNLFSGGKLGASLGVNQRYDFLEAIDAASKSLDLFHVVTPEKTYTDCNITGYSYRREQTNGAYMLVVEIDLVEIRRANDEYTDVEKKTTTTNAKDAGAKPAVNNGSSIVTGKQIGRAHV